MIRRIFLSSLLYSSVALGASGFSCHSYKPHKLFETEIKLGAYNIDEGDSHSERHMRNQEMVPFGELYVEDTNAISECLAFDVEPKATKVQTLSNPMPDFLGGHGFFVRRSEDTDGNGKVSLSRQTTTSLRIVVTGYQLSLL